MQRSDVIQQILSCYASPTYLEIGVDAGSTFFAVTATRKIAVDPCFKFPLESLDKTAPDCTFHPMESDCYFAEQGNGNDLYDVAFIDGLHQFEQTLRDLNNVIARMKPNGVIIIDDVIPSTYQASIPDLELSQRFGRAVASTNGDWMGDVYKLVYYINTFLQPFSYATVAENHGQTILWRRGRPTAELVSRSMAEISGLQYLDVMIDKSVFNIRPFAEIIGAIKRDLAL